jgi:flavin reductase (DIM6/NTAB) family NADH-FMN oxidoreductase RutF
MKAEKNLRARSDTSLDSRVFRAALGHYASGLTVISGIDGRGPIGFTCQSFFSVSMEPSLVSFSVMVSSTTYPRIRATGAFAVNVLSRHQKGIAKQFARARTDKWAGIDWVTTQAGNPVIAHTLMWLDCDIWAEYPVGDHFIVVGKVNEICQPEWHRDDPLLFFRGEYRELLDLPSTSAGVNAADE